MPYLRCPGCGLTDYSASAHSTVARCSHCGERLAVGSDRARARPSTGLPAVPGREVGIADIVELQDKIAARIHHGGSLADVRREIIEVSSLDEHQRNALWCYAASQPQIRREAKPLDRGPTPVR